MDDLSIETLITFYYDTLLRIAVQHTGNRAEAEDIVQDTFLKLLESRRAFHDQTHAKAFLIRACINRCRDWRRSARHTKQIALTEDVLPPDSGGFLGEDTQAVLDAMQQLRPEYRDVIYLYYYEGYPIKEIAAILHRSSNTVSSWLTRAKKQMKEVMLYEAGTVQTGDGTDHDRPGRTHGESRTDSGSGTCAAE